MIAGTVWKTLVSASFGNLVWNLALINLANQKLHIKYGFDKATNIKGLYLLVFINDKKIKWGFKRDLWGGAIFDPRAVMWTILVKVH